MSYARRDKNKIIYVLKQVQNSEQFMDKTLLSQRDSGPHTTLINTINWSDVAWALILYVRGATFERRKNEWLGEI